jgi:hypothetical protein
MSGFLGGMSKIFFILAAVFGIMAVVKLINGDE